MRVREYFEYNETVIMSLSVWRLLDSDDWEIMYKAGIRYVCVDDLRFTLDEDGGIR